MPQVLSLCNKQFLKNHNFRQKFHILLILTGKNASKWLEWCIFRVWGMPNPMALVVSLYDKQFMKNHNFRRHIAENFRGSKPWKWDGMYAAVLLGSHFTTSPYLQNPISCPSHKNAENYNNSKSAFTQFQHCMGNWHTQKSYEHMCKPLNTFSLCKLTFSKFSVLFCQGELRKQPKFHILLILTGKNASKWLEWCIFRVLGMLNLMPQGNKQFLKNHKFQAKNSHFVDFEWEKCIETAWVTHICSLLW